MTTPLTLRLVKGSPLTSLELDNNFKALRITADSSANAVSGVGAIAITSTGSTTARTLADRAADVVNVKDEGAVLDGTTNDTKAWNDARIAAGDNGTVFVPRGGQVVSTNPTGGSANPILWKYSGNYFGTGTSYVISLGTDIVETFLGKGGKYVGRGATAADTGPVLRLDNTVNHTGGTGGFVIPTLKINTTVPADGGALNNYVWGISSVLNTYSTGPGQNVAIYGQANKYSVSNAWAAVFDAKDHTGLASNAGGGPMVPVEVDLTASGADPTNIRVGVDTAIFNLAPGGVIAEAGVGYRVSGGTNTVVKSAFTATCAADVVYDASSALTRPSGTTYGLRMKQGQMIDFKGDGTHTLGWFSSGSLLQYSVSGTTFFSIAESPNLARFFTALQAAAMDSTPIGLTTPAAAKFTTLTATSALTLATPVTVTAATYTVLATDTLLVLNPSAGQTLTLGTATNGRVLWLKLISAFAVTSASSNVVPQVGGAAGTAILVATAGKFAMLVGDGTNWQIMNSN